MNLSAHPRLAAWYSATRPRVFTASYVPMGVAAAAALEDGVFDFIPFVLALIGTMFLQTAANLVNEYYDFVRGADELKQAGQGMAIKNKILTPREVMYGAIFTVVAGSLIGLYLLSQSGPLLWFIGIGGVLVAITYTAGPFPLAYNGLGELAAGIFMGPMIVVGAYYVMDTNITWDLVWISLPIAFTVAAILHANNIRDMDADRSVNKRTLAVLLGRRTANAEYAFLVGGAYVLLVAIVLLGLMPPTVLLAFITLPEARRLINIIYTSDDTKLLHQAQGRTAKLHGQFGLWIVVGWLAWLIFQQIV
ncbi:MAG: 1,4-dihydroxy-2-naphthoate polyprenyltransferase [Anaerolineae bacterium]